MARYPVKPTTRLELRDLPGERVVLTREQWQVAAWIDGVTSVRDLSRACGLALAETAKRLGELIEAGLCVSIAEPLPARAASSRPTAANGVPALQRRTPRADRPATATMTPPSADTLRRVVEGLRKLS